MYLFMYVCVCMYVCYVCMYVCMLCMNVLVVPKYHDEEEKLGVVPAAHGVVVLRLRVVRLQRPLQLSGVVSARL